MTPNEGNLESGDKDNRMAGRWSSNDVVAEYRDLQVCLLPFSVEYSQTIRSQIRICLRSLPLANMKTILKLLGTYLTVASL